MNEHTHWPLAAKPPPLDRPEPKSDLPSATERMPNQRTSKIAFKGVNINEIMNMVYHPVELQVLQPEHKEAK